MSAVIFYVSGHGFGHAVREVEVIAALHERQPHLPVIVRTAAPCWLFDRRLRGQIVFHHLECDTGVVQIDSLRLDERDTIARAAAFHRDLPAKAAAEARFLREAGACLVVGDVPPLAFAAAAAARIPAIAIANFTWDWIYEGYADRLDGAPDLVSTIRRAYSTAVLALRLPMWGGFECFRGVTRDLPFIGRHSQRPPDETRGALGLPADRPLILVSFGGYGLQRIDLDALSRVSRYAFVLTSRTSDPRPPPVGSNVCQLDEQKLYESGFRYEDLVAAADAVVTKPGYGIVADCVANDTAILYTSRGRFVEYDAVVAAMRDITRCLFIGHDDLFAGRWGGYLDRLLDQPPPPQRPPTNGADAAADAILRLLGLVPSP